MGEGGGEGRGREGKGGGRGGEGRGEGRGREGEGGGRELLVGEYSSDKNKYDCSYIACACGVRVCL